MATHMWIATLLTVTHADSCGSLDEASMLQMPDQKHVQSDSSMGQIINFQVEASECRCPGYIQQDCEEQSQQGCFWGSSATSTGNWCQCGDPQPAPPVDPAPQPAPSPPPAPTIEAFFTGDWAGNRNNYNGDVGLDILANQDFTITHLGRHANAGSLSESVLVSLWSSTTQQALAQVQVGPESVFEGNYAFAELASPVTVSAGEEYRLSQQCTSGMPDSWFDSSNFAATQAQGEVATFIGGVYRPGNGYPERNDGTNRRPGMINFKFTLPSVDDVPQCAPAQDSTADQGYNDAYRGWYDVQGCGECNDYCRWVGNTGSLGEPSVNFGLGQNEEGNPSWWSCRLAGSDSTYSPRGYFSSFNFQKCN